MLQAEYKVHLSRAWDSNSENKIDSGSLPQEASGKNIRDKLL